jgi:DNA-binding transcriptional MerR regulator
MKRIRRSPDQIIRRLKTADQLVSQGQTIAEIIRFIEVAHPTHITAGDSRAVGSKPKKPSRKTSAKQSRLIQLEKEIAQLEKLLADAGLEKAML